MKKHFYFKPEEQKMIISSYMLECISDIGPTTYIIKVDDDSNIDLCLIILTYKDNGTIMQKWACLKDTNGKWTSVSTYKNYKLIDNVVVYCDTTEYDGVSCFEISDDNNIKCFLCENKPIQNSYKY
jgi:hypothetical protein